MNYYRIWLDRNFYRYTAFNHIDLKEFGYRFLFRKMFIKPPNLPSRKSQIHQNTHRINRQLPLKGRTRGDVGIV